MQDTFHSIELRGVTKRFGSFVAVNDVSFSVERGEIVSLLGPSGCGKTTTLRMIAGFEHPEAGSIAIAGQEAVGLRPYERNVGLVFQHFALFPHMTVADNIAYGMKHRDVPKAERPARMREILELVKLSGLENRRPSQLSGGQQQRVALARALVTKPSIVLLDEPLSALDAKLRQALQVELRSILKRVECSTIIVTHDQEEAMSLSDRLLVMNAGRIEQEGTPAEIYSRPQTRFVADFIGQSNWFSGQLKEQAGSNRWLYNARGLPGIIVEADGRPDDKARLGIRPEHLRISQPSSAGQGAALANAFAGTVTNVAFLGPDIEYSIEVADGVQLLAIEKNDNRGLKAVGNPVMLSFEASDVILLPE
jgi:putative spermidine/putrescine transport system ATP-binding protein/putrescine transport system ATP-binding protein